MPVAAPTEAGRATDRSGSRTPTWGAIFQLMTGSLLPLAGLSSTAKGVTSLAVP